MSTYRIHYKDPDPGCPVFSMTVKAYDREHAIDKFYGDDDQDWEIVKVTRLR